MGKTHRSFICGLCDFPGILSIFLPPQLCLVLPNVLSLVMHSLYFRAVCPPFSVLFCLFRPSFGCFFGVFFVSLFHCLMLYTLYSCIPWVVHWQTAETGDRTEHQAEH